MKHLLILILALLITAPVAAQQPNPDFGKMPWKRFQPDNGKKPAFSPWEYMKKEDEFITKRAKITMIEANSVCPLLHKMKDELRKIDKKIRHLLEQGSNDELSDMGSKTILKKIKELNEQKLEIENDYHRQMLKTISAKKLLQLLQADVAFDRFMLQQMFMDKQFKRPKQAEKKD